MLVERYDTVHSLVTRSSDSLLRFPPSNDLSPPPRSRSIRKIDRFAYQEAAGYLDSHALNYVARFDN